MEQITEARIIEAAEAVNLLKTSADLDQRIEDLRERCGVATDRQVTFSIDVPESYSEEDKEVFKLYVTKALAVVTDEANNQVKFERTWSNLGADE